MGYDHSMNAEIEFKPGVAIDAAMVAIEPISEYFGWKQEEIFANDVPQEDTVELTISDGEIQHMSIYTCGEVKHSFREIVENVAGRLQDIAKPGFIELRDHDTGDLENAIERIWYGSSDEVREAQHTHAWQQAMALLRGVGKQDGVLAAMATVGGFGSDESARVDDSVDAVESARLFWRELLDSMEALTSIVDEHGSRTLVDLFYLQNAILEGGFIDAYPGESHVLDVARALPSGGRWANFIKLECLATQVG